MLFKMNPEWILNFRSEMLISWFKIFPFFASDYLYITIIAIAYWLNPRKRLFLDLGWLISFATLLNVIIKKAFSIPRPPSTLHMLPINDGSFGFPSGDVQVATVFFMIIFLSFNSKTLKIISITMIINIMLSRLYLGVHSIYDVIGGMIFGVLIVLVYRSNFMQAQISRWENSAKSYYCILAFVIGICFFLWKDSPFPLLLLLPIGTLLGYGIVYICFKYNSDLILNNAQKTIGIIISFILLFFFYKTFPIIKNSTILFNFTPLLKFALLPVLIYILLPMIQRELKNRLN